MTEPARVDGAKSPAAIVFLAVALGAVTALVILAALGTVGIVEPIPNLPLTVMRLIGLVLLVSGFTVAGLLSGSISPRQIGQDDVAWWRANSAKAVVTWAMAEGLAIIGGVLFMLTGDLVLLAGLGIGGLVILGLNRPGRMMEG